MLKQLGKWGKAPLPAIPFEVACRCGTVCRGLRQRQHQEIPCPTCRRLVFVLPAGALTPEASLSLPGPPPRAWPVWLGPVLAGVGTLVACVLLFLLIVHQLLPDDQSAAPASSLAEHIRAGRLALQAEDYDRAHRELTAARAELAQHPQALSAAERRQLDQAWREAGIMASWPGEPLDLIAGRGTKLRDEEWLAVAERYRGRGMVFDVIVRRDAAGSYSVTFHKEIANQLLRLDLENQSLLRYLPLNEARRLLLGARLTELRRDGEGLVHIRLEPDSAALLTEASVLKTCGQAIDPNGAPELAEQQRQWALDLP